MSETIFNVATFPDPLNAAAAAGSGPPRRLAGAGEATPATNPFAALLAGVLSGSQPPAGGSPATLAAASSDPVEQPDGNLATAALLALPGSAAPLPATPGDLAGSAAEGNSSGNPLPLSGNSLPPALTPQAPTPIGLAGPAVTDATRLQTTAVDPAPDSGAPPGETSRTPTALAEPALGRPPDTTPSLPGTATIESARATAAALLAGRSMTAATKLPDDAAARSAYLSRFLDQAPDGQPLTSGTGPTASALAASSLGTGTTTGTDWSLLLAGTDLARHQELPVAGQPGGSLAGPLAAFAAATDTGGSALAGTPASGGLAAFDGSSAALLNRLGTTSLPTLQPLGDAGTFAGGLADRLLTVGGPGTHTARLKLHPEHLGELNVEITMEDGTAQVWFGTTSSQAREAIEGSLLRLRELFADQGIQLTRTEVDTGGGQMGSSGFGQERRMTGGAGAWDDVPAWQPGRTLAGAESAGRTAAGASARLLDVWA